MGNTNKKSSQDNENINDQSISRSFYLKNLETMRASYNYNTQLNEKTEKMQQSKINIFKSNDGLISTLSACNLLIHLNNINNTNKAVMTIQPHYSSLLPISESLIKLKPTVEINTIENIVNNKDDCMSIRIKPKIGKGKLNKKYFVGSNENSQNSLTYDNQVIREESELKEVSINEDNKSKFIPYNKQLNDSYVNIHIDLRQILIDEGYN